MCREEEQQEQRQKWDDNPTFSHTVSTPLAHYSPTYCECSDETDKYFKQLNDDVRWLHYVIIVHSTAATIHGGPLTTIGLYDFECI